MNFEPIQNYGLIGNMRSAALVSTAGSIDFFCFPEFDSPSVFTALLDPGQGGAFAIFPEREGLNTRQMYIPETNVLLTRFLADDGIVELTDFMPVTDHPRCHCIMRRITVINGETRVGLRCAPRFNYARSGHRAEYRGAAVAFTEEGAEREPIFLQSSVSVSIEGGDACASFLLKAGETAYFVFGVDFDERPASAVAEFVEREFASTCDYWRQWTAQSRYSGRWREMVNRSALVLKLLTDSKYGSLIAAPTFGLPEAIGGPRNWDYRYTWLRDSSFSLYALMRLGYTEEGRRFNAWLKGRLQFGRAEGPLQTMYGIDGRTELPEYELGHLEGYRGSKPVRIGNAAFSQLQLDIYGEMFDASYLSSKYGDAPSYEAWQRVKEILKWLAQHWSDPDEGIWEVRGGRKEFLHSRMMCWVAFDRVIRLGRKRSLEGPFGWMEECRDAIVQDIQENFWDSDLQAFVQYKGAKEVDASALLMPLMRFISPLDPRWVSTLERIERELTVDTLVRRYRSESNVDGLAGQEGSFTACSFWFIEALARSHQVEKARLLFEKMLGYANHLGLYSEELSESGEHLGNYPQALTHLALISAATYLNRALENDHKERTPWS
jgi:GH15 family glucan-1,4-alpha-glucosidase